MGKNLKGKELGKGLYQRKDKKYEARFTTKRGDRISKTFDALADAKQWLSDNHKEDELLGLSKDITLDEWFKKWIAIKKGLVKSGSLAQYRSQYKKIGRELGDMMLRDIKPIHIQGLINEWSETYKRSTVCNYRTFLSDIMQYAVDNELIRTNPVGRRVRVPRAAKDRYPGLKNYDRVKVLTVSDQEQLLKSINKYKGADIFRLTLQTGLRTGEVTGLKWENVDFEKRVLHIRSQAMYIRGENDRYVVREDEPKTINGIRDVPLTDEAERILRRKRLQPPEVTNIEFAGYVFLSNRGTPIKDVNLNMMLKAACKKVGIPKATMHTLRHTFATRCIEGGMKPKTLQMILGHANIKTTMDLYVHVTEDEKHAEINKVQNRLSVVN